MTKVPEMIQNIISKAKTEAVIQFKFGVNQKNISYADDIRNAFVTRYYSVFKLDWSVRKPINRLILEESFTNLKIYVVNDSDIDLVGESILTNVLTSEPEAGYKPDLDDEKYIGSNIGVDDYLSLGEKMSLLEREQNYFLNKRSIIEVLYRHTKPDTDSTDMILGEYSLLDIANETCCRIITENNELPKMEISEMNEWGMQFASSKAWFSSIYFESIFGKGSKPRESDFLTFSQIGRSFNVSSVAQLEGVNGHVYGYQLSLKNYDENSNISGNSKAISSYNDMEDLYHDDIESGIDDILKDDVNRASFIFDDQVRYLVQDIDILKHPIYGNYYSPKDIKVTSTESVIYDKKFDIDGTFSMSFMIKLLDNTTPQPLFKLGDMVISVDNGSVSVINGSDTVVQPSQMSVGVWTNVIINFYESVIEISLLTQEEKQLVTNRVETTSTYIFQNTPLVMLHNSVLITKIRLWKKVIPIEYFKRIILSKYVEKASIAWIIDDVSEILNIPVIKRSKLKGRNSETYSYTHGVKTDSNVVKMTEENSSIYYSW